MMCKVYIGIYLFILFIYTIFKIDIPFLSSCKLAKAHELSPRTGGQANKLTFL